MTLLSQGPSYDSSYLPFLFDGSIDAPEPASKPKGRRKFDVGGKEIEAVSGRYT